MLITYATQQHRPPHRVSCRLTDQLRAAPADRFEGTYRDGMWIFDLPDDGWTVLYVVLDGQVESAPLERSVLAALDLDDTSVRLTRAPIAVDDGVLQQTWFAKGAEQDQWDLIVVGTGMGGGVLLGALTELAIAGKNSMSVLGLEAGSLLFPTHVANLPRRTYTNDTSGDPSMWNTLPDFETRPWDAPDGWSGHEVFAFGGRSLYWGALCPRLHAAEIAQWPESVGTALTDSYYDRAEELLSVQPRKSGDLERRAITLLEKLQPGRISGPAPVAVRTERGKSWELAGGVFSTADLLLAQRLSRATGTSYGPPYIHLGELVTKLEPTDGKWLVRSVDLRDGTRYARTAKQVVVCGGTVETPRLMAASGLTGGGSSVGQFLTEHMMSYVHFQIPPDSPFHGQQTSAKILSIPGPDGEGGDFNILLELGADLNEGRAVPSGWTLDRASVDPGNVAGQLVFLGRSSLDAGGRIDFEPHGRWPQLDLPPDDGLPPVSLVPYRPAHGDSWQPVADSVLEALGARPMPGAKLDDGHGGLALIDGRGGFVSHEVGTMRMDIEARAGVVDDDLQMRAAPGVYVCDNSVFPTSPAANPSLTLAALAIRLADHLRR